jgi:hypothetical protein
MGKWRRLHNKELHNLYPVPIIIGDNMMCVSQCRVCGENQNLYTILNGIPNTSSWESEAYRYKNNIKMKLKEIMGMRTKLLWLIKWFSQSQTQDITQGNPAP